VYVVAILTLAGSLEDEASALAGDLGSTAYETRLVLAAGTPAVVLQTVDMERARFILGRLRSRGHGAVACDDAAIVASSEMVAIDGFSFEQGALVNGDGARLPLAELAVLIPAMHRNTYERRASARPAPSNRSPVDILYGPAMRSAMRRVRELENKLKALGTQPPMTRVEERENVLYLYVRENPRPWFLREGGTSYAALGPRLLPTQRENFQTLIELLRAAAPHAIYDDRLLALRRFPERAPAGPDERARKLVASQAGGVDLTAHLLAMWSSRAR